MGRSPDTTTLARPKNSLIVIAIIALVVGVMTLLVVQYQKRQAQAANPLCGSTITTSVALSADMDCSTFAGTALTIGASGVTLDGAGFKIIANGTGVRTPGTLLSGITVKNLTVENTGTGQTGIHLSNVSGALAENINVSWTGAGTSGIGIIVTGNNNILDGVTANRRNMPAGCNGNPAGGICVAVATNTEIKNSTANDGLQGIHANVVNGINIHDSVFNGNATNVFVRLASAGPVTLSNVDARNATNTGVAVHDRDPIATNVDVRNSPIGVEIRNVAGPHTVQPGQFVFGNNNNVALQLLNSTITVQNLDLSWTGTGKVGTGIRLLSGGNYVIDNVTVSNRGTNTCFGFGGGICVQGNLPMTTEIKNSFFNSNMAGIATIANGATLYVHDTEMKNNTVHGFRGFEQFDDIRVEDVIATGNQFGLSFFRSSQPGTINLKNINACNNSVAGVEWNEITPTMVVQNVSVCDSPTGVSYTNMSNVNVVPGQYVFGNNTSRAILLAGVTNAQITGLDLSWTGAGKVGSAIVTTGTTNGVVLDAITANNRAIGVNIGSGASNVEIKNSQISNGTTGIQAGTVTNLSVHDSTISGNATNGLNLTGTVSPLEVYRNNIFDNGLNVRSTFGPIELSLSNQGNFWGHTNTAQPCFFVFGGTNTPEDSNRADITDSHCFTAQNGWNDVVGPTITQTYFNTQTIGGVKITSDATLEIEGTILDASSIQSFTINGQSVTIGAGGNYHHVVNLTEGLNTITFEALDSQNNPTTISEDIILDTTPPSVTQTTQDQDGDTVIDSLTLTCTDAAAGCQQITYSLNGGTPIGYVCQPEVLCSVTIPLPSESTTITYSAEDVLHNESQQQSAVLAGDNCPTLAGVSQYQGCLVGDKFNVDLHTVDLGAGSGSTKVALAGVYFRIFDRTSSTFQSVAGSQNPKGDLYGVIFEADAGRVGSCTTDATGACFGGEATRGDFLAIGKYVDTVNNRTVYIGRNKDATDFVDTNNDAIPDLATKQLQILKVLRKGVFQEYRGGSKVVITGSRLEVITPDSTIWSGDKSIYPFIFTSDSDWTVDVCAEVPSGYKIVGVIDQNGNLVNSEECVQTLVNNASKVVAFEIQDIGSPEPTFTAKITAQHKGKTENRQVVVNDIRKPAFETKAAEAKAIVQAETDTATDITPTSDETTTAQPYSLPDTNRILTLFTILVGVGIAVILLRRQRNR